MIGCFAPTPSFFFFFFFFHGTTHSISQKKKGREGKRVGRGALHQLQGTEATPPRVDDLFAVRSAFLLTCALPMTSSFEGSLRGLPPAVQNSGGMEFSERSVDGRGLLGAQR